MTTSQPKSGYDSWTDADHPNAVHGSDSWLHLQSGHTRAWQWLPMPDRMAGRTIASALLTLHAHGAMAAQTLTVTPAAKQWQAATITSANKPGTTTPTASLTIAATADLAPIVIDVTSIVQAIANGSIKNYGWQITTNYATATQTIAAFNADVPGAWLTVDYAEVPDVPSGLAPNGAVVGAAKPIVSFDFAEYGADQSDLAAVRVEVDTNGDGTVDWNSGWVTAVAPTMDLAAQGMTGTIAAGQTVKWRAYVQDANGGQSAASEWATYTYQPLGTITLNSPAAGVMYDPTSDVLATFGAPALAAYRIQITDGLDRTSVRFDSGKVKATSTTSIAYGLPLKNDDGSRIFTDNDNYQLHIRAWDTYDRQATPGVPSYVDLWTTIHFNDDAAQAKVSTFTAAQVAATPFVQLTWTDSAAPDAYIISRDTVQIARLNPADVVSGVSTYSWQDSGAAPAVSHTYEVRRLVSGGTRSQSKSATITIHPEGVWLLRDNGDYVVVDGTDGLSVLQILERRLRYTSINLPYVVDILTQYEGYSSNGPLVFSVEDQADQTLSHAQSVLDGIKRNSTETVQFIAGTISKPVRVTDMEVFPDPEFITDYTNRHVVRFNITQVGDFDFTVG